MPKKYDQQAIDKCRALYLKFGGKHFEKLEREMRRIYPGWSKQNLTGKGKDSPGWIELYGWDKALELHLKSQQMSGLNAAQKLAMEIEFMREQLYTKASGDPTDKDLVNAHRDYCKLHIDALVRIESARHSFDGFVDFWERLLDWLPDVSVEALNELIKVAETILEKARAAYGVTETTDT